MSATRECTWTVGVEGSWLSLKSPPNGQGDGTVEFSAAANPDPVLRRGALVLNGQRAEVTQNASQCDITLAETSANFTPAGGSGRVDVRASSALCTWSAASDRLWIAVRAGTEGKGSAPVMFDVAPTNGPPRTGILTVAGQSFSVTQSEGCAYSITPEAVTTAPGGGSGAVAVTTAPECPWTASSNVNWLTFAQGTGSGPASVNFTVLPTNGPSRTGTAVVAGHPFTVTQSQGCTYQVQPSTHSVGSSGGSATVNVSAGAGCAWNAFSDVPWITIQSASPGSGSGLVTFAVAATTGAARAGSLTVAGHKVIVNQGQGCTYSISPTQESVPATGGGGRVTVTAADGCGWSASSAVPWITITAGSSGSGGGVVTYTAAATTGPARSGTMQVAGQVVTVNQGQGCAFAISPANATVADAGGQTSFEVQSSAGCAWTASASSQAPWITIASGASGNGNGTVQLTVAANTGPARSGTVTAAGRTFTVNQGQGCTFAIVPASASIADAGGPASFEVQSPAGCGWTAASQAPWITVASGGSGSGNGIVQLTVGANTGPGRMGTVTAGGHTFTVNQGSGCSYALTPASENVPAGGANGTVNIAAPAGCGWTATSTASWLSTTGAAAGTGAGSVAFAAAANTGAARSGTLAIGGQTFTVNQAGGCTFTVAPETIAAPLSGGPARVDVAAATDCAWTATSGALWITVTAGGSGTGPGAADLSVSANTGSARTGAVTVAGRTVTVNQESGCTFAINPTSASVPAAGTMTGSVNVTAGAGCAWTAVSQAPWIIVSSGGSRTGNGVVQYRVGANATGAPRSGTIAIAGLTFTVTQD